MRAGLGDPGEWPVAGWWLLAGAMAVATATLGYGVWLAPARAEVRRGQAQLHRLQAEVAQVAAQEQAWRALGPALARRGREQAQVLRALPGSADLAAQVLALSRLARASGLECEQLVPAAEQVVADHVERPLAVRLTGRYRQFVDFADALARTYPPIVLVPDDIALVRRPREAGQAPAEADPAPPLELSGTVRLLRRLERGDHPGQSVAAAPDAATWPRLPPARLPPLRSLRSPPAPVGAVGDPFVAALAGPAPSVPPVASTRPGPAVAADLLQAAVMVGRIGPGAGADALVRTPDRQIHRLAAGSRWGAATVVEVLETGVRLRTIGEPGQEGRETWIRRAGPGTETSQ